jgi:PadR family transcriptional regulator AphA
VESISGTDAALLGQLAWRAQTPYELAKGMERNLRFFWPRAASHVYRQVKRLERAGLATAERGATGRRPRTVYAITPAGRQALRAWLAGDPGGIELEHDPLLRVFLCASGEPEDALRAIRAARERAEAMLAIGRPLGHEYLEGRHAFQEQVHIRALSFDYLYRWAELTRDWADGAEREVSRWRDTSASPAKHRRALARLRRVLGS